MINKELVAQSSESLMVESIDFRQNALMPENELPHVVLPEQNKMASANPAAPDTIVKTYAHGIEFADQVGEIAGYLATLGLFFLPISLLLMLIALDMGVFFQILAGFLVFAALVMIREDFHGQKYNPVLFNKALGLVHIMEARPLKWFEFLFMPWRIAGKADVSTFPWDCARGEVATLGVFQGVVVRQEHNLFLAFTENPESNKVVFRTAVGTTTAYDGGQGCVDRWEHIRRFMRGEGPAFRQGDRPWNSGATTFWRGVFYGQMLMGPGSGEFWRSRSPWVYVGGTLSILIWPMSAFHGLVRWACYAIRKNPKWPPEIAASVGPAAEFHELQKIGRGEVRVGH